MVVEELFFDVIKKTDPTCIYFQQTKEKIRQLTLRFVHKMLICPSESRDSCFYFQNTHHRNRETFPICTFWPATLSVSISKKNRNEK